jgi:hypothetical protein
MAFHDEGANGAPREGAPPSRTTLAPHRSHRAARAGLAGPLTYTARVATDAGTVVGQASRADGERLPSPAGGAAATPEARAAIFAACALPLLLLGYLATVRWLQLARLSSWTLEFYDVMGAAPALYHRLPPDTTFALPAWLANLLVAHGYWLVYGLLSPDYLGAGVNAMYWTGLATLAANLAGVPVLYALGVRRGLSPALALLPAVAYALCYPMLEKAAWDLLWPGATLVFLAAYGATSGRRALFWISIFLALGTHPLSAAPIAAWVWGCRVAPRRWHCAFIPSRAGVALVTVALVERVAFAAWVFAGPRFGSWISLEAARISSFRDIPIAEYAAWTANNASWIVLLFATFGFLSLRSRSYAPLVIADVLYYVTGRIGKRSSIDHGELPVTMGLLALAAVDALAAKDPGERRPYVAWVAAGIALGWLAGLSSPHSRIDALLPPPQPLTARAPLVHEAIASVPEGVACATHSSFAPLLETRCRVTSFAARFPAAEGKRYSRRSPLLTPPDAYLIDLGRIAGQPASPGFSRIQALDGGCLVVSAVLEEVRAGRCGTAWERDGVVVLRCTAGGSNGLDEPLSSRLGELLEGCSPAGGGLD